MNDLSSPPPGRRDALTGLAGAEEARGRLDAWLTGGPVHALMIALPRLSAINLAYGNAAGDFALAEAGARLLHFAAADCDSPWLAARLDGSRFLLAAQESCSRERWTMLAEGLAQALARPISGERGTIRLSPRIALLRALPGETAPSLIDRLGEALAALDTRSGARLLWAGGDAVPPGETAEALEADLLRAIDRDEIELAFQPQFALPDDRLTGAEALARWNHPALGRIGAGALFAIAERAEYIAPLSHHIARLALAHAADWPAHLRLSLNVTPADLAAADYSATLMSIIASNGFDPARLTLEVTEQAMIADIALARRTLKVLSAQGIKIALDDFGAGFCNFRYLKVLPLDGLKLDRSMVDGIVEDPRDLAVLRGIMAMARALDLAVTAEGIESEAQRALVAQEGCATYQGFVRAAPMGAGAFRAFARNT